MNGKRMTPGRRDVAVALPGVQGWDVNGRSSLETWGTNPVRLLHSPRSCLVQHSQFKRPLYNHQAVETAGQPASLATFRVIQTQLQVISAACIAR